jgi:hypothetical protein
MKPFTNACPMTNLGISVAASLLPLVVLGIPKITGVSHKVRNDGIRSDHLTQVAQYYKARACYRLEANQPLTRGDIIPHPVETACYEVTIDGQPVQLVYVTQNPETGLIQVSSTFTHRELSNQLSILNQ